MFGPGKILITSTSEDSDQKVLKISLNKTFVVSCHISKVYEKNRVENVEFKVLKTLKITKGRQGAVPKLCIPSGSLTCTP